MTPTRISPQALEGADDIIEILGRQAGVRYTKAIRTPTLHMQIAHAVQRAIDATLLARATQKGRS